MLHSHFLDGLHRMNAIKHHSDSARMVLRSRVLDQRRSARMARGALERMCFSSSSRIASSTRSSCASRLAIVAIDCGDDSGVPKPASLAAFTLAPWPGRT